MKRQYILTHSEYVELKELLNDIKLETDHIDHIGHGYTVESVKHEILGTIADILIKLNV